MWPGRPTNNKEGAFRQINMLRVSFMMVDMYGRMVMGADEVADCDYMGAGRVHKKGWRNSCGSRYLMLARLHSGTYEKHSRHLLRLYVHEQKRTIIRANGRAVFAHFNKVNPPKTSPAPLSASYRIVYI